MKIREIITTEQKINGLALLQDGSLVYICGGALMLRDKDNQIECLLSAMPDYIDPEVALAIKASENERYVVVYTLNKCYGFVFDRQKAAISMHLQRGDYHVRHCIFPIALFEQNESQYLVHATDWNVVHITNLETAERITDRVQIPYEGVTPENKNKYLDYFHSMLHISPGKQWIISNGWVWGPAALLRTWNLQNWLLSNPYEVEDKELSMDYIGGYSWNRPLCWINEDEYLLYFNSGEDEDNKEEGMEPEKSYLLICNVDKKQSRRYLPFEGFHHNEYWECLDGAALFYSEGRIISSCPERGISVIDLATAMVLEQLPGATLDLFHERSKTGASVADNKITLYQFT